MRKIAFILAPMILSVFLTGCTNKPENENCSLKKAVNSFVENANNKLDGKPTEYWANTKNAVLKKAPQRLDDVVDDIKTNAPVVYKKSINSLSKISKEAQQAMDENFNAIFD
ncbi:hypothetical protein [Photobacterium damselae]|uniref:hypothetical protein n=1 Tax=Photobacterium damselae TaxID=38293 RepID=UPI001F2A2CC1|nr:hypothetical protein [Photobacterium damselae]UKA04566.1 hypothetical protein IHC89_23395 [Photobacterium damselae subsp. damselae]